MKLSNGDSKQKLITRLRRIEGQVRGVQVMLDEERDCKEILQQLTSIRSAVQAASLTLLQETAADCLLKPNADDEAGREELLQDLFTLLGRVP